VTEPWLRPASLRVIPDVKPPTRGDLEMFEGLPRIFRALLLLGLTGSLVVALAVPAFARSSAADDDKRSEVEASQLGFGGLSDAVRGTLDLVLQLVGVSGAAQNAAGQPPPEPGSPLDESRERHKRAQGKLREADARQRTIQQRMDEKGAMGPLSWQRLLEYGEADEALKEAQTEEQRARDERIKAIKGELARLRGTADTPPEQITELVEELEGLGAKDDPEAPAADQAEPTEQPAPEKSDQGVAQASLGSPFIDPYEPPTDTPETIEKNPFELPERDLMPEIDPVTGNEDPGRIVIGGTVEPVHLGDGTGDQATQWFSGGLEDLIKGSTRQGPPEGTGVLPGGCGAKVAAGVPCPGGQPVPPGDIGTWAPAGLTGRTGGCDLERVNALSKLRADRHPDSPDLQPRSRVACARVSGVRRAWRDGDLHPARRRPGRDQDDHDRPGAGAGAVRVRECRRPLRAGPVPGAASPAGQLARPGRLTWAISTIPCSARDESVAAGCDGARGTASPKPSNGDWPPDDRAASQTRSRARPARPDRLPRHRPRAASLRPDAPR
jgi:hypothetical protein